LLTVKPGPATAVATEPAPPPEVITSCAFESPVISSKNERNTIIFFMIYD
jgi:hypothetical protein